LPLKATEVDPNTPFAPDELLYRRAESGELNSKGEIDPTRINLTSFKRNIESAPSVNRGLYSSPDDVLHVLCADKDLTGWHVFSLRVDQIPTGLVSGDKRVFDFYPKHVPLENCGAHSVVACAESNDPTKTYVKPSDKVAYDFKAKFATALRLVPPTAPPAPTADPAPPRSDRLV
jgi:hypothetical protein